MTTTITRSLPRLSDGIEADLQHAIPEGICRTFRVMPYVVHEGHGVGRDVHPQEQSGGWLHQATDGLARSRVVEHVPMLSAARDTGPVPPGPGCFDRRAG